MLSTHVSYLFQILDLVSPTIVDLNGGTIFPAGFRDCVLGNCRCCLSLSQCCLSKGLLLVKGGHKKMPAVEPWSSEQEPNEVHICINFCQLLLFLSVVTPSDPVLFAAIQGYLGFVKLKHVFQNRAGSFRFMSIDGQ